MRIKFNEVTWYSKLLAGIVLILLLPALTFYIGIKYEQTSAVLEKKPKLITLVIPDRKSASNNRPVISTGPLSTDVMGKCGDLPQQAMNACTAEAYTSLERIMDSKFIDFAKSNLYTKALEAKLTDSQSKWLIYRETECVAQGSVYEGGSLQPTIVNLCKSELTTNRIKELDGWLKSLSAF